MVFVPERDNELWHRSVKVGKCELGVSVMSYDGGESKIQLNRKLENGDFARLGRFTIEEMKAISPLVNEAIIFISDNKAGKPPKVKQERESEEFITKTI